MCHLILLSPVFGLVIFWFWPLWISVPIYAVILVLSILLYIASVRAMRFPQITGTHSLLQRSGVVIDIDDRGPRVRIGGEIWQAHSAKQLELNDRIKVVRQNGITLEVERDS